MARERRLYPSILSADFADLGKDCAHLRDLGCNYIHVDVMDGSFVPPISFGEPVIRSLRASTDQFLDVHMMVLHPETHIESMKESGADSLTIHAEACVHLDRTLQAIRDAGMEAGVSLNPSTPLGVLDYVLDRLDQILLMTVNPGYGGQSYLPAMTEKIRSLRKKLDEAGYPDLPIQVDGGIMPDNVSVVLEAGADRIVSGSGVFSGDRAANVAAFEKAFREVDHV